MTTARVTEDLWTWIRPIYEAILAHPFLTGLAEGTLPEPCFRFYVVQDALYLRDFARALAVAAAKAPQDPWCELFAEHAKTALVVERALHESFFQTRPRPRRPPRWRTRRTSCAWPTPHRSRSWWGRSCPATGSTGR
jgi:hypothetical protein